VDGGGERLERFGLDQPFTALENERVHAPAGVSTQPASRALLLSCRLTIGQR
jgi:hypothetical protein